MKTIRLEPDSTGIARAAQILQGGGLVAFPTETVYGLGADATDNRAVASIFAAKNRPQFNPLIVHLPDLAAVEAIAELPAPARTLASAFWPGPLTLVLKRKAGSGLSDLVTAGLASVAIRIPEHPLAQSLLRAAATPIAAPSANPSGKISPTTAEHVLDGLSGRIDAVLDGGACSVGLESTIIGFDGNTPVQLRAGGLPPEAIEALLGRPLLTAEGGKITAPGQLQSHYAPEATIRLNADTARNSELLLAFGQTDGTLNLSPAADLHEAAANLFAYLRKIDALAAAAGKTIAVSPIPHKGLGIAINDRLTRAAAPR